jgi:predicted histidine transporter YuiF (NhaC family)
MLLTKIQTYCKKHNAKILENARIMLFWILAAILNIRRHLEYYKKKSSMKYFRLKSENRAQKYSKLTSFSAILKIATILKTCEENFSIFSNLEALIFIQHEAKN